MADNIFTGQLDQRISIVERVRSTSTTGSKNFTTSEVSAAWAKVEDVAGNEELDGKVIALNVRRYIIRYNPAVEEKQINDLYIVHSGATYNIHSVDYVGRKEYVVLKCSKRE